MQGESVFNIQALTGLDRTWVKARRNDCCFMTNKFLSVALSGALAAYTGSLKPLLTKYHRDYPLAENL